MQEGNDIGAWKKYLGSSSIEKKTGLRRLNFKPVFSSDRYNLLSLQKGFLAPVIHFHHSADQQGTV
jgi:hypothetical protein